MIYTKSPLVLLTGIIMSIIILSIVFPADPTKPDLISSIKGSGENVIIHDKSVRNYMVRDMKRIDTASNVLSWSLDEKHIYYTKLIDIGDSNGPEEIWVSDILGNKDKINCKHLLYRIREAKWSPDGITMGFIANLDENKSGIFIYNSQTKAISNITPKNITDVGVTSYGWDDESLYIVMSVDIEKPRIEIYNTKTNKIRKLDMNLKECKSVAFYKDGRIIFFDKDNDSKYGIYSADESGKNIKYIAEGREFLLSPDKNKLAILSDGSGQEGLWFYNIGTKYKSILSSLPIYNIYWLLDGDNVVFSTEADCRSKYTYKGNIYYVGSDLKAVEISGVIYTIFAPAPGSTKIAILSPDFVEDKFQNKGVFIGELHK